MRQAEVKLRCDSVNVLVDVLDREVLAQALDANGQRGV